ncbi:MAG: AsnC family transcriptional regulator [Vulcanibacillus sp.]
MINATLEKIDQELLNILQREFPLVERPYLTIGNLLKISESEVINRIEKLKGTVIRQISAIFDTKSLGYESSLVAANVNPNLIDKVASIINQHPGVTHNYQRNHEYNLWFTIAVPPDSLLGLEKTVNILGKLAGVNSVRLLPTLKVYKIGVQLDMTGEKTSEKTNTQYYSENSRKKVTYKLDGEDIEIIKLLQKDFLIVPRPFDNLANEVGLSVEELLNKTRIYKENGLMRRLAAVLYHREAGFNGNGMGAWSVQEDQQEEIALKMSSYQAVSHCYLRPTYPDWPYNIFTMVHAKDNQQVEEIIKNIEMETGIKDRFVLYSIKEYKKTRLLYFDSGIDIWERELISSLKG